MAMSYSYFSLISPCKSMDRLWMDKIRVHMQHDQRRERCGNTAVPVGHNQKEPVTIKIRSALIDEADRLPAFAGGLVENGQIFQQRFSVKSYEGVGLNAGGFGCTLEMCKRNLIYANRRTQISLHRYPTWGDIICANTWLHLSKRGKHWEWLLRDIMTGETVAKVVSVYVTMNMNMNTRKHSAFAHGILSEMRPHARHCDPIISFDAKKVRRVEVDEADHIRMNLTPMWNDLDANSHVSNVKYINWILEMEGVPCSILEEYVLDSVYIEYRRERGRDSKLKSLSIKVNEDGAVDQSSRNDGMIGLEHLLLLDNGTEMARAGTKWRRRVLMTRTVNEY